MADLVKTNKPPMGGFNKGIMANKAAYDKHMKETDPKTVANRLGLVLDDSASMGQQGMEDAHKAVQGFTANCSPMDTSIAVYPLNASRKQLTCDFDLVNMYVNGIWATGGTPIYGTLSTLIETESITRAVVFSDGDPTDSSCLEIESNSAFHYGGWTKNLAPETIKKFNAKESPIDTIYIGDAGTNGYKEMKELARLTNGTFIHFKDTASLSSGLKYLAPKYRALLSNPEIKAKIERGENV